MSGKTTGKRKRTQFSCFICGRDNESVSYFKFPKNATRSTWLSFVNLPTDFDDVNLHLCSQHFSEDVLKKEANRYTLRVNAVPTLLKSVSKKPRVRYNRCTLCTGMKTEEGFVSFPSDAELKEKWVNFCGMSIEQVSKTTFLCHRHFKTDDFTEKIWMKDRPMKILKPDAVPSIHTEFERKPRKLNSHSRTHCRLCDYNRNDTSYFKFPKNAEQNSKWRRICGLDDLIDTNKMVLCGRHFSDDQKVSRSRRTDLKPSAVPTLNIGPIHKSNTNSFLSECILRTSAPSITKEMSVQSGPSEISSESISSSSGIPYNDLSLNVTLSSRPPCSQSVDPSDVPSVTSPSSATRWSSFGIPYNDQSLNVTLSSTSSCSQSVEPSDVPSLTSPSINAQTSNKDLTPAVVQQSPRKRKLRFFGDVRTTDLATPHRARKCWDIAKRTIIQKNLKIRSYQEKILRLQKQIRVLSDLTDHLRAEKFISKYTAEHLMAIR